METRSDDTARPIRITGNRTKMLGGEKFINTPRQMTKNEALDRLIYELSHSGKVVDVSTTQNYATITIEAKVLFDVDTTVFTGPLNSMLFLAEIAYYHSKVAKDHRDTLMDSAVEIFRTVFSDSAAEEILLRIAAIMALEFFDETDMKLAAMASVEDMVAAAQLAKEGACSFREALNL